MYVSVAMATYNGEKYLREQLESILKQLNVEDELIVSDDGSVDDTMNILKEYELKYKQIKVLFGPEKGFVKNFENAIRHCTNQYIFLTDQDDIWFDKKIEKVLNVFKKDHNIILIMHDAEIINDKGQIIDDSFFIKRMPKKGYIHNIIKSHYFGCCMAFRHELFQEILPFPDTVPSHDQWISNIAEKNFKTQFIHQALIQHRIHNNNVSKKLNLYKKLQFRWLMIRSLHEFKKK